MSIELNLKRIKATIPENVKLVAVSKTHSIDTIMEAHREGHRIFGENKVQELVIKKSQLPVDIRWHFIGHLQRNKVRQIISFVDLIHGVDSGKLLEVINKEAENINHTVNCLLQVHIAEESTKFGFSEKELFDFLSSGIIKRYANINICGLMGMATYTDDNHQIKMEFKSLKRIFDIVKSDFFLNEVLFKELSMGMSDDYEIAIEEGSTIIRVGSAIFGQRNYL
jgi:pyridoxal phosphate enzyme (YggS family)